MRNKYYKVGGHTYKLVFFDDRNTDDLLMSSKPFEVNPIEDDLLFTMQVNDNWSPHEKGQEIGHFDCGGNMHDVYKLNDGSYQILVSNPVGHKCCLMETNATFDYANVKLNGSDSMRLFGLNNALMMVYAFAGSLRNTVLIHASVVRKDSFGYLCLGVSGTGKSTHTGLWLKHIEGTDLMNDDNPVVRVYENGTVRVYGSPWSGKTPCYRNTDAPVGAFLQLKQAPYNKIRQMSVVETFASLLPSCSVMKWDERNYTGVCDTIKAIMENSKTFLLECLPDEAACQLSYSTIRAV